MRPTWISIAVLALVVAAQARPGKKHALPPAQKGGTVVGLCDGETSVEVADVKPGEVMSRTRAQAVSDELMREWRKRHPEARWDELVAQNATSAAGAKVSPPPGSAAAAPSTPPVQTGTYDNFTNRDEQLWAAETQKLVDEGNRDFHDAKLLGGTIGVSCDMCHPNAANTHPETYPKFQVQLGRVALLRDMINWCVENPLKGKALHDDDDRMRALEAYILSQRRGVKLEPGKH